MCALTSLLGQHTGLLALPERCEEVASMFDRLLSLSLPLALKSKLYRSIAEAMREEEGEGGREGGREGGLLNLSYMLSDGPRVVCRPRRREGGREGGREGISAAVPLLREGMRKRLGRFLEGRRGGVFSPLSLFEMYGGGGGGGGREGGRGGGRKVALRDDLPELLLCVMALERKEGGREGGEGGVEGGREAAYALPLEVARLVLLPPSSSNSSSSSSGNSSSSSPQASSLTSSLSRFLVRKGGREGGRGGLGPLSYQALEALVAFVREGCPMEGEEGREGWREDEGGREEGGVEEEGGNGERLPRLRRGLIQQGGGREGRRGRSSRSNNSSCHLLPPCDPDAVSTADKLHLFLPLIEVLIEGVLTMGAYLAAHPPPPQEGREEEEEERLLHTAAYQACLELYKVHGMLSDVGEVLGVKGREGESELEGGRERERAMVGMEGGVYLLQLFMLTCRGWGWGREGGKEGGEGGRGHYANFGSSKSLF